MTTLHGWKTGERGVMKSAWNFCQMSSSSSGLRNSDHSKVFPSSVNQIIWKFDQINKTEDFEINFLNLVQSKLLITISFASSSGYNSLPLKFFDSHRFIIQLCHQFSAIILLCPFSQVPNPGVFLEFQTTEFLRCWHVYTQKKGLAKAAWIGIPTPNHQVSSSSDLNHPETGKIQRWILCCKRWRFLSWNPSWEACMVSGWSRIG